MKNRTRGERKKGEKKNFKGEEGGKKGEERGRKGERGEGEEGG